MSGRLIEFQVLGPTEATRDGRLLPLSGARRRALVTRLLLDAGRMVPTRTLIEDVWAGEASRAASATLQSHISQLRKVLGPCVQHRSNGYVLELDEAVLDAVQFETRADDGSVHLTRGRAPAAAALLREALGLWRGAALQDVAEHAWAQPEAARLEEIRRVAEEQLLRARLETGEPGHVVADAEAAVTAEPLREGRWATLMLALYRTGRQADALRAYQRLRTRLAEELGIDPSPALAELEAAILRQDGGMRGPHPNPLPAGDRPAGTQAGDLLAGAHRAAAARDWPTTRELLTAANLNSPLGPEDLGLLGDAAFMTGDQDTSIAARQRAHSLWLHAGDSARAAVLALVIVGNHYVRNRPAIAAGWFQRGARLLQDQPEGPAQGVLAFTEALVALAHGKPELTAAAGAQAQRIGARFAVPDIEAVGQTLHAAGLIRLGRLEQAQPMLDEALAWASSGELGPIAAGQIFCWSTQALLAVEDYERAAEWITTIESSGIGGIPGDCRVHRAEVLRALGRYDQAEAEARAARGEIQAVDLLHAGIAHHELAMIHLARGDPDAAELSLGHAAACGASDQPGAALLLLAREDPQGARKSIWAALADPRLDELGRVRLIPAAVQIALAAGEDSEAAPLIAELEAVAARFGSDGLRSAARAVRESHTNTATTDLRRDVARSHR